MQSDQKPASYEAVNKTAHQDHVLWCRRQIDIYRNQRNRFIKNGINREESKRSIGRYEQQPQYQYKRSDRSIKRWKSISGINKKIKKTKMTINDLIFYFQFSIFNFQFLIFLILWFSFNRILYLYFFGRFRSQKSNQNVSMVVN